VDAAALPGLPCGCQKIRSILSIECWLQVRLHAAQLASKGANSTPASNGVKGVKLPRWKSVSKFAAQCASLPEVIDFAVANGRTKKLSAAQFARVDNLFAMFTTARTPFFFGAQVVILRIVRANGKRKTNHAV
jgi:hypothetical protein